MVVRVRLRVVRDAAVEPLPAALRARAHVTALAVAARRHRGAFTVQAKRAGIALVVARARLACCQAQLAGVDVAVEVAGASGIRVLEARLALLRQSLAGL